MNGENILLFFYIIYANYSVYYILCFDLTFNGECLKLDTIMREGRNGFRNFYYIITYYLLNKSILLFFCIANRHNLTNRD